MTRGIIRSLTLHYPVKNWASLNEEVEEALNGIEELASYLRNNCGFEVWTKRLTLPSPPLEVSIKDVMDMLEGFLGRKDLLISMGSYSVRDRRLVELKDAILNGFYAYFMVRDWEELSNVTDVLTSWSEPPYEHMTRVGVDLLGDLGFVTPYYPLSQTPRAVTAPSVSFSFMLPKALLEEIGRGGVNGAVDYLYSLSIRAMKGIRGFLENYNKKWGVLGPDLSISPWMEDSVGELIESLGGCEIGGIGCISVIYYLNKIVREVAGSLPASTGFNEIMMAVAEDSLLKKRVYEGKLSLRDLLEMVPVCLAGIDMIALKSDRRRLLDLLSALKAYAESKRKTVGFRAIILPYDVKDEKIISKKFGDIPVLSNSN